LTIWFKKGVRYRVDKARLKRADVVILCGGKGTRLREETHIKPKPMVEIGGKPMLWHIMKYYASFGYNRFILALGYKGDVIKKYFYDYRMLSSDFTLKLDPNIPPKIHAYADERDWEVVCVDTGQQALKRGTDKKTRTPHSIRYVSSHLWGWDQQCRSFGP